MGTRHRRLTTGAALLACALLALLPAPANAGTTARTARPVPPPGARGPVVTHPVQQPGQYAAGEVCPFPARADFPVSRLTLKTWYDRAGHPVFATEGGPLLMRATNLSTGRSVVRDISGSGVITSPTPTSMILSGTDWSAGFHTSDRPAHNAWIVARGYMSVELTATAATTSRTLLALRGPWEDLCKTLS